MNDLRLQVEALDYENKDGLITVDDLKDDNQKAREELDDVRRQISDLKNSQQEASLEEKERRKQEKVASMMSKFDPVSDPRW